MNDYAAQEALFQGIMRDVTERLARKRVSIPAPDGSVTVTVDGNGDIRQLDLARGVARRIPVERLGATIRDTINAARAEAGRRSQPMIRRAINADPNFTLVKFVDEEVAGE